MANNRMKEIIKEILEDMDDYGWRQNLFFFFLPLLFWVLFIFFAWFFSIKK
jgi:hypothetical protein